MSTLSQMIDVLIACANNIASAEIADTAPVDRVLDTALDALSDNCLHDNYLHVVKVVL